MKVFQKISLAMLLLALVIGASACSQEAEDIAPVQANATETETCNR
jgi:hypothetical protein